MKTVALIPARYQSSRFPGKPLVKLLGKPMILWVTDIAAKALGAENVYVVTDDERIASVVREAGYQTIKSSFNALTGTDRLAEASEHIAADVYINIQGDEPLVNPDDILKIRDVKLANPDKVINGFCWLSSAEDPASVNIPKVITNERNELVYMSRNPLPGHKESDRAPQRYKKQVCIYAFSRAELAAFRDFGRKSELEWSEDIEILRFLELSRRVLMVETSPGSLAVDVREDVAPVEKALEEVHRKC
ncbi:3-deoxy-manno-octulosonate cytidylyltransferase [Marinobacter psychrophilus]|jgi:3-deoxy-manno-octulosonate cytidylyltransferase (CMP-KDO synthetase)|uniref:3-deoxy-manno-octulosonate cytidylyltransferase n=1 Tax=Marinobacter psychrophilus TaxID=330734 RepID=A0A0H4I1U8_9GAMM|nr:3-deoxy-manno-octulosonate cytidylyltransferase [Marinobacter psychrophilus]AKO51595.1 3-deoxy-manno-octulosonate cytidylyltransferase [Marinobacter psychrophilus]